MKNITKVINKEADKWFLRNANSYNEDTLDERTIKF